MNQPDCRNGGFASRSQGRIGVATSATMPPEAPEAPDPCISLGPACRNGRDGLARVDLMHPLWALLCLRYCPPGASVRRSHAFWLAAFHFDQRPPLQLLMRPEPEMVNNHPTSRPEVTDKAVCVVTQLCLKVNCRPISPTVDSSQLAAFESWVLCS